MEVATGAEAQIAQRTPPATTASGRRRAGWGDLLLAAVLAAAAAFASFQGAQRVAPKIITRSFYIDEWFEADAPRVFADMSNRLGPQYATVQHPLFPILSFPLVKALRVAGLQSLAAVQVVFALVGALWLVALFSLLRLMGCRRLDAVLFSVLASVSASAVFGFTVPETWPFGSLTILLALVVFMVSERRALSPAWYVATSALTLSVTLTNWMAGIFAAFARFPWRRALQITVNAFCLVVFLWWGEKFIFPSARFFLRERVNTTWVLQADSSSPLNVANAFLVHAMVMPAIQEVEQHDRP